MHLSIKLLSYFFYTIQIQSFQLYYLFFYFLYNLLYYSVLIV